MKIQKSKLHEFHFKIDVKMRKELIDLKMYKQQRNFSQFIVNILKIIEPRLEKELLTGRQRNSRYQLVNADVGIGRKSIHIYFPQDLYRKLKLMHHDLNFYSIGQLVRFILRLYLDLIKAYGERIIKKLKKLFKKWKEERETRRYKIKPVRQLLHFIYQKPAVTRYLMIYSDKYCPIGVYRF